MKAISKSSLMFVVCLIFMGAEDGEGGSWWNGFIGWIFNGMKRWFCWLVGWFMDRGNDVITEAITWMPAMPSGWWANLVEWFGMINAWIPVDTFIFCSWSYITCLASTVAFRFWRRFLPF